MISCKKKILFYSSVRSKRFFYIQGFYRTDINILRDLGYRVLLSNSICDFLCFWKYNVAFIYFYRFGLFPAIISKLFGKKVIFTGGIDLLSEEYGGKKAYTIQKYLYKLCNIFSDKSLIISTTDKQNITKIYNGYFPKNNIVCFHSIDTKKYRYDKETPKRNIILTIAWMAKIENVHRKGVLKCIETFKELADDMPEYDFYIIGQKGEGSIVVEQLINHLGLNDRIFLTGSISENEKIQLLKSSKYYMQLSDYEGFGIAAIEALIAGNIVIHSGKGGLIDAVGNHGILIKNTNDFNNIAKNIYSTYLNGYNDEKITSGIEYIENNFTYRRRKDILQTTLNTL